MLTKVLVNRLKKVVEKVVSKSYNAFNEGGQILDALCIVNKAKNEAYGVMCKLHIKKVYDHMNGGFLLRVLEKMSFGKKWNGWIK